MSVRDEEIKRLIYYAKGLGVKVIVYKERRRKGDAAAWTTDGSQIEIFAKSNSSKTSIILSLIHELGHHVWFIHEKERQPDLKFDEALERENLVGKGDRAAPKHLRKKIYDVEKASTEWWNSIYKETDIKIPEWKLTAAMEFDTWMYEEYYETGFFPKGKHKKDKYREVQAKHRGA